MKKWPVLCESFECLGVGDSITWAVSGYARQDVARCVLQQC